MDDHSPIAYDDAMARAAALAEGGRLPEATAAYRRVAADHPHQPGAHYELGILHHQLGEVSEAIACFERAAALMPRDASIWNNLGVLHYAQGDDAKAEQCLRQAVALDGSYGEAWFGLGRASERAGRRGDAVVAYRACLSADASQSKAARSLEELQDAGAGTLKVGFVSLWYERGQAYVTQMLRNAIATEHETYVLARNGTDASRSLLSTAHEWAIPNLTTHPEYALPRDLIRQWITDNGLEVVFFNEEYDLALVQAARETGARTIGIYYWELFDPAAAEPVNAVYDAVICPTRCSYERFRAMGITRAVHVPWGIDADLFRPVDRPVCGKVRFFHPAGWGGLHARRGTQAVIDAFREADLADAELLVHTQHGEGIERAGNITIRHGTVPREELVRMYQESDVAVLPSKWEGLGLTFLEAMGCGLPIITLDAPPMSEFVVDGETGILCPVSERKRYQGIYVEGVEARTADLAAAMARLGERDTLSAMRTATLCRAPDHAWSERSRAVLDIVAAVRAETPCTGFPHRALGLSRKDYSGCNIIHRTNRRYLREGDHEEQATVHLVGARRSNFPWGMENEIYRALELAGCGIVETDFRQEFADLAHRLDRPAHLLLAVKANGVPPELIRQQSCPTVLWYPDDIFAAEHARPQLAYNGAAFDRVYTFDPCAIDEYRKLGMRDVRWLPLAASPALHRRMYLPKVYDVSFVGNVYPNRRQLLERLSNRFNVLVTRAYTDEMVRIFNQSKITLNLGIGPTGIQLRVFEALACGCFLLTNEIPHQSRLFTDREHLVYFGDRDIEDLVAYYLDHEDEREEIAHNGYLEAHAKHTFAHRVDTILQDTLSPHAPPSSAPPDGVLEVPVSRQGERPSAAIRPQASQHATVAVFAPTWEGRVDDLALAHIETLRDLGTQVSVNAVSDDCSCVLSYGDTVAETALAAARRHRLPLFAYVLDIPFWRLDAPPYADHYRGFREILIGADQVFALSAETARAVNAFADREATVWRMGLPMSNMDLSREELDVEPDDQIIYVSRIVEHKHPELIIEALATITDAPRLLMMGKSGEGPLIDRCQRLAREVGVSLDVVMGAPRLEVARQIRSSKFLVTASTFEGFGMTPGEALLLERPALASDLPVFREVYGDHVDYFAPLDAGDLAVKMHHLLSDDAYRARRGREGRAFALETLTVRQAAIELQRLLDERVAERTAWPPGVSRPADAHRLSPPHDASRYDGAYYWRTEARTRYAFQPMAAHLAGTFRPARVLDVACGMAFLIKWLRNYGVRAYGCDHSQFAVEHASEPRYLAPGGLDVRAYLQRASAQNLPYADDSYDLVSCLDLLEHLEVPDAVQAFRELERVTSRFLFMIITVHDEPDPDLILPKGSKGDPTHVTVAGEAFWRKKIATHTRLTQRPDLEERARRDLGNILPWTFFIYEKAAAGATNA